MNKNLLLLGALVIAGGIGYMVYTNNKAKVAETPSDTYSATAMPNSTSTPPKMATSTPPATPPKVAPPKVTTPAPKAKAPIRRK